MGTHHSYRAGLTNHTISCHWLLMPLGADTTLDTYCNTTNTSSLPSLLQVVAYPVTLWPDQS